MHSRLVSLIEKLQISWKLANISENGQNEQIFMKIMKLMKNTEIVKFSIKMPYRLVSLLEKLQISRKITNFSENDQI